MIVDTNALSDWVDGDRRIARVIAQEEFLALPIIVLGEYRFGLSGSKLRIEFELRLAGLEQLVRILDVTNSTAREYARIRAELKRAATPIPANDAWIAALAREHGMRILSQDAHFDYVDGIERVEW